METFVLLEGPNEDSNQERDKNLMATLSELQKSSVETEEPSREDNHLCSNPPNRACKAEWPEGEMNAAGAVLERLESNPWRDLRTAEEVDHHPLHQPFRPPSWTRPAWRTSAMVDPLDLFLSRRQLWISWLWLEGQIREGPGRFRPLCFQRDRSLEALENSQDSRAFCSFHQVCEPIRSCP